MLALSSCAPSLESVYRPLFEPHEWVFSAERTGLNSAYKNIIRVVSQPVSRTESLLRVHVFPDDSDPKVGARQTYKLVWKDATPRLTNAERAEFIRLAQKIFLP